MVSYLIKIFKKINFRKVKVGGKKYPRVLQFPITYKCNSRCRTCNIWKINKEEISLEQFKHIIKDSIFKKIESVGINGGEPSLVKNLDNYVSELILSLPRLRSLNIITNGFETNLLLRNLKKVYQICKKNNIKFHVSISLDGYKKIHNESRGVVNAFENTVKSINEIKGNLEFYADSYDVACTISKINVDYVNELDQFAIINNIKIKYRMAVEIKRLLNKSVYSSFNAMDEFSAREHIFRKVKENNRVLIKFRYFSIFNSIISKQKERLAGCLWQNEGITLDPYGNIYYCAVRSKILGNLLKETGKKIFFSKDNLQHRNEIIKNCNSCVHDYEGKPYWKNFIKFINFLVFEKIWIYLYKFKKFFL